MQRLCWLLLSFLLLFPTLPALAFDCDNIVTDDAGVFAGNQGPVETQAGELGKLGAAVRVRTFKDVSDLGSYLIQLRKSCPSWQDSAGGLKATFIGFFVEMKHHQTFVRYGDLWRKAFADGGDVAVQTDSMNPYFKSRDFVGGFVNGMKDAGKRIDAQLHPKAVAGSTTVINQAAADYSGFVSVLVWLLIVAAIAFVLFVVFLIIRGRRRNAEERSTAQQKAMTVRTECSNAINGFDLTVLTAKVNAVTATLADDDAKALKDRLERIKTAGANASADFARLSEISSNNPEAVGLPVASYATIEKSFRTVSGKLEAVYEEVRKLEVVLAGIEENGKKAPQLIEEAQASLGEASAAIDAVKKQGYHTQDAEGLENEAEALLGNAQTALTEKRAGAAASSAAKAKAKAKEALAAANKLIERKGLIDTGLSTLASRISGAGQKITETRSIFEVIRGEYADSSWQTIAGNGSEAERMIGEATAGLARAQKAASMEVQDWTEAEKVTGEANTILGEADKLLGAIGTLKVNLEESRKKAEPEIKAAEADIEKAEILLSEHKGEVDPQLRKDLERAQELLDTAQAEMKKPKPDYVAVVKGALAANSAADRIFEAASSEIEALERLRRNVRSTMEEAERSIDAAAEYINTHSHVKQRAKDELDEARTCFRQASSENDLGRKLELATRSDQLADSSLEKAKRNVRDHRRAQQERRDREASYREPSYRTDRSDDGFVIGAIVGAAAEALADSGRESRSESKGGFADVVQTVVTSGGQDNGNDTSWDKPGADNGDGTTW